MNKKLIGIAVIVIMLFGVFGCGYPVEKFSSLAEMQAVMPNDFYYFDLNQEGIKEAGRFEATKKKLDDGSYIYLQYFIWYDVEYMIDGQPVTRSLQVVGVRETNTIFFEKRENRLHVTVSIENEAGPIYYFVLDGVENASLEREKLFIIYTTAINNRYKK